MSVIWMVSGFVPVGRLVTISPVRRYRQGPLPRYPRIFWHTSCCEQSCGTRRRFWASWIWLTSILRTSCTSPQWKQARLVTWSFGISTFCNERGLEQPSFLYHVFPTSCAILPLHSKITDLWDVPFVSPTIHRSQNLEQRSSTIYIHTVVPKPHAVYISIMVKIWWAIRHEVLMPPWILWVQSQPQTDLLCNSWIRWSRSRSGA